MSKDNSGIIPFCFGDNLVRIIEDENGIPWFVAKDVCNVLDIQNPSDTIKKCLDDDEKGVANIYTPGGIQEMLTISESGLYALVFRSCKPEARAFSKWVRSEVLPSIRRNGYYKMPGKRVSKELPEDLPEEALLIPPGIRQRIWQDAIQTASLDGGGAKEAREWFAWLCRLNGYGRPLDGNVRIWNFMDDCLEPAKGHTTPFAKIVMVFEKWWRDYGEGPMPGTKHLSEYLALRYQRAKSSVSVFRNCRIRDDAV